jgi:hypothetical protein
MRKLIVLIVLIAGCDGPRLSESIESLVSEQKARDARVTFRTDLTVPHLEESR